MSIAAKKVLMNTIAAGLGNTFTTNQVVSALGIISQSMDSFNVEQSEQIGNNTPSDELLDAFLSAKEIEGRSPKTIARYRYVIDRMQKSLNIGTTDVNVYHLRKYLMELKNSGSCDTTIGGYRDIIHNYFGWLYQEGLVPQNPSANLGNVKAPKTIRKPFSFTEIERMKEACTTTRDKAILLFLLSTGCRISEVCALNRNDVNLQKGECVVFGKGAKERRVYISEVANMILRRYFEERTDSSPALFVGKGTARMTPGGIRAALNAVAKKARVENVHPHRFRRTLATTLIDRGMSIQEVAAILGHERLDTTMKYVYISQSNVENSYRRHSN